MHSGHRLNGTRKRHEEFSDRSSKFPSTLFLIRRITFHRRTSCLVWAVGENENASRIAEREMKTVLKDVKTGLLFRNMDEWTSDLEQAASFRDTLTALKFCQRNNLDGAAIVHVFGGGKVQRVVGFYRKMIRQPESPAVNLRKAQVEHAQPKALDREESLS